MTVTNYFYKATLAYNGSSFLGWQIQESQGRTIQGELKEALKKVSKSSEIEVIGSSRTDAGVHAREQIAKLTTHLYIEEDSLVKALNVHLPSEIRVLKIEKTQAEFQPSFDVKSKIYSYYFLESNYVDPFLKDLISNYPFKLNVDAMSRAASLFIGEHDFKNFMTVGTPVKTTVRTIYDSKIIFHQSPSIFMGHLPTYFEYQVHGNGFLKQMVRQIMGCIWTVGREKMSVEELQTHLRGKPWDKRPTVAPPQGLYLEKIFY